MADLTKALRIRASGTIDATGVGVITFDFTPYLQGQQGLVTRMIAGVVESGAAFLRDNFQRTVAAGSWGSPDFGPAWATLEEAGTFSVDGARGMSNGVVTRDAISSPIAATDAEMLFLLAVAESGAGGNTGDQARALLRVADLNNYYFAAWENPFYANNQTVRIARRVAAVETNIASFTTATIGALYPPTWMRFSVVGSTLTLRAWRYGDTEPSIPTLQANDGNIVAAGGAGFGTISPGAVATRFLIDSLVVSPGSAVVIVNPTWDAYIGDINDSANLIDSSQGLLLPRWVPALVNGQPVRTNETLSIVASGGVSGTKLVASCYLALEP